MRKLLIKLIPKSARRRFKMQLDSLGIFLISIFARSGFTASIYYTFFSRRFFREHKAVLQGRLQYRQSLKKIGASCALLRRNIHRLEKGLIMQPRRNVFAEDYIGETVSCFLKGVESKELCAEERKWAEDVLSSYFQVVGSSAVIDAARNSFKEYEVGISDRASIPYPHRSLPECPVDYTSILRLFERRRSVRWYKPVAVPDELLRKAVRAATMAPSACNRQPYQFYVVNETKRAAEVARCAMGTSGFAENLQCIVAVVGDLSAYPEERDRHLIYIDGALASMQLMLAFESLGLSSCPINWPDIEQRERDLGAKLELEYHQRTIMLIAVGYAQPEGGIPFSQKKTDRLLIKEPF